MQEPSASLAVALVKRTPDELASVYRNGVLLFEVYPHDYYPPAGEMLDPDQAIAHWARTELTWLGNLYRRQVLTHAPISRFMTAQFNTVSITFANNDLFMSAFMLNNKVEGMRLLIRYFDKVQSIALADTLVCFTGRLQRPSFLTEEECNITAGQELGSINYQIPRRVISSSDPLGRSPNDPLFEGFRFGAIQGSFQRTIEVTKRFLFFFTKKKKQTVTEQWSSQSNLQEGKVLRSIWGRVQIELDPVLWADVGPAVKGIYVAAGHKISSLTHFQNVTEGFLGPFWNNGATEPMLGVNLHLGDPGGTGSNAVSTDVFPTAGLLSKTAYTGLYVIGSSPDVIDPAAAIIAIAKGEAMLPDEAGVFNTPGFTDNPSYLTRFILTDAENGNQDPRLVNDAECIKTARLCDEFLLDTTNGELAILSPADADALDNGLIRRFRSTGVVNALYWKWMRNPELFDDPFGMPLDDPFIFDIDLPPPPIVPVTYYRRRYTFNAPLTEKVNFTDFLFKTLFPTARLYMLTGGDGRLNIRTERPADSSYVRSDSIIGANQISINDVEVWRESTQGLILIGVDLVTSETRKVIDADYSAAGNAITLEDDATGTTTLTKSGATLAGGTADVPPSGTFTVGGVIQVGSQIVATIDGVAIGYQITSHDDLGSAAAMLQTAINANWQLKSYIRAVWDKDLPNVVTVYSKLGILTLDSVLDNAHDAVHASPVAAPAAAAVAGGAMIAGEYQLGYSYTTAVGETFLSPVQTLNLAANQRISVPAGALPAGVAGLNWYLSKGPDDATVGYIVSSTGGAFFINALPAGDAAPAPLENTAGEETIRVMGSFSAENILTGKFKWPLSDRGSSTNQVLIKYREAAADFAERELYVNDFKHQEQIHRTNKEEIDGTGIDNFNQANRIANSFLSKEREGDLFVEWSMDEAGLIYEEGDVVCVTDRSGEWVNLPLRIEDVRIDQDLNVTFIGRRYSTIMYSDQTGQKTVVLPSTLKYVNQPPPDVEDVTIAEGHFETVNNTWISTISGQFDFGDYVGRQFARIYVKYEGELDYRSVENVLPDPDNHGSFEIVGPPRTIGTGHSVKIVTESQFGYTNGVAAAEEFLVEIIGPPPMADPEDFVCFFDEINGDGLQEWAGHEEGLSASQVVYELDQRNDAGTANLRPTIIIRPDRNRRLQEYIVWNPEFEEVFNPTPDLPGQADLLADGGVDFVGGFGCIIKSLASAEIVGGLLLEWEVPGDGFITPTWMSIYPDDGDGFNFDDALYFATMDLAFLGPPYTGVNRFRILPEGHGAANLADAAAWSQPIHAGDRFGIYLRPDGIGEYHRNYSEHATPLYISGKAIDASKLYQAFMRQNSGEVPPSGIPGVGVRKVRWERQGPEFKYVAAAQRIDRALDDADPLPDQTRARVRQLSPWANGTHSDWVDETFVRP